MRLYVSRPLGWDPRQCEALGERLPVALVGPAPERPPGENELLDAIYWIVGGRAPSERERVLCADSAEARRFFKIEERLFTLYQWISRGEARVDYPREIPDRLAEYWFELDTEDGPWSLWVEFVPDRRPPRDRQGRLTPQVDTRWRCVLRGLLDIHGDDYEAPEDWAAWFSDFAPLLFGEGRPYWDDKLQQVIVPGLRSGPPVEAP